MFNQQHADSELHSRLAAVLPKGHKFSIYHISTPPTKTDAIYLAPPDERADRTYCENHFLAISIDAPVLSQSPNETDQSSDGSSRKQVLVLGIEIFIYTTAFTTTLFVSKADSTGYLHLLKLPKGTPSPIREIPAVFISFLIEKRRRRDAQFVVNLFARAQDQYLFPGSVDHGSKHVLDDRGLIKWWCRVLNPLLESPPKGTVTPGKRIKAYVVVPGLDTYETRAFVPRSGVSSSWSFAHPLERISHYTREFDWVPPRCLIPHFPDDPKSRFVDELDEEAAKSAAMKSAGTWKSVKTLDMFWEMMAYRQECSSGRLTGFIWVVFDDEDDIAEAPAGAQAVGTIASERTSQVPETPKKQRIVNVTPTSTPRKLFRSKMDPPPGQPQRKKHDKKKQKTKLRGPIIPRKPRIKTEQHNYLADRPTTTAYYYWPPQGRGERLVGETDYKRMVDLLLNVEFSNLEKAISSTRRWVGEVGMGHKWGHTVTGTRALPLQPQDGAALGTPVNNLSNLVKRKRTDSTGQGKEDQANKVNVLDAGLVRRKSKEETEAKIEPEAAPQVNVLSAGLVRKKPKAQE